MEYFKITGIYPQLITLPKTITCFIGVCFSFLFSFCTHSHAIIPPFNYPVFQSFDSLVICPSLEVYKLRFTLFQAEKPAYGPMAKNNTKNFKENKSIGFDIGNNFFLDINGNLSLRLDSVLGIHTEKDFKVIKSNHKGLPVVYTKKGQEYKIRHHGLFHLDWNKKIQAIPYGYLYGSKHIQKKLEFHHSDVYEYVNNRIHTLTKQNEHHFKWQAGSIIHFYKLEANKIISSEGIKIVYSHKKLNYYIGDKLKGYIEKTNDSIFVYEIGKKPLRITTKGNALEIYQGRDWLYLTFIAYQ